MTRTVLAVLLSLSTTACGVHELPPPAAPPATVPEIADAPTTPPASGTGRLLLAADTPAKVSRVTEEWDGNPWRTDDRGHYYRVQDGRKTQLLCLTPCAVDLPTGAHALVFTSLRDPERTSTTEVAVPQGTTVVRHAIGTDQPNTSAYLGGEAAVTGGIVLLITGGLLLGVGSSLDSTNGQSSAKDTLTATGAILGGVGVVALAIGIVRMVKYQPQHSAGATTTFRVASP